MSIVITIVGAALLIGVWLWWGGRTMGPTTYLERDFELAGRPTFKFKVGERVSISDKTGTDYGTVTELTRNGDQFAVTWDDDGSTNWHAVIDQDDFEAVVESPRTESESLSRFFILVILVSTPRRLPPLPGNCQPALS